MAERKARNPRAVFRAVGEETIVMMPDERRLHVLNSTAALIWNLLAAPRTPEDLAAAVTREFDCDAETARRDVGSHLADLDRAGLLVDADD